MNIFLWEVFPKPKEKNYATNRIDVFRFGDTWILDILDWKDFGAEEFRGQRYVLVVIDIFSKFGLTVPLKIIMLNL